VDSQVNCTTKMKANCWNNETLFTVSKKDLSIDENEWAIIILYSINHTHAKRCIKRKHVTQLVGLLVSTFYPRVPYNIACSHEKSIEGISDCINHLKPHLYFLSERNNFLRSFISYYSISSIHYSFCRFFIAVNELNLVMQ